MLDESEVLDRIMQLPEYGVVTPLPAEGTKAGLLKAVHAFDQQMEKSALAADAVDLPLAAAPDLPAQALLGKVPVVLQGKESKMMKFLIVYTCIRKSAKDASGLGLPSMIPKSVRSSAVRCMTHVVNYAGREGMTVQSRRQVMLAAQTNRPCRLTICFHGSRLRLLVLHACTRSLSFHL
jgi:hypothetical protein